MTHNERPSKDAITRTAYALYLMRGCGPGRDLEDWVNATKELSDEAAGGLKVTPSARPGAHNRMSR